MPNLCDVNVLLALCYGKHIHHPKANEWFHILEKVREIAVCRITQLGLLRLLSNPSVIAVILSWSASLLALRWKFRMSPITKRSIRRMFALAQDNLFWSVERKLDGWKPRSFVRTVAERLVFWEPTTAPPMCSSFQGKNSRFSSGNGGFVHDGKSYTFPQAIKAFLRRAQDCQPRLHSQGRCEKQLRLRLRRNFRQSLPLLK